MKLFDFFFAFKLAPKVAYEYFKQKGLKITKGWRELWKEAHAKAFTVANCAKLDVLMDIREQIDAAIKDGITGKEFEKRLTPELQKKGWWGKDENGTQLGSPARLALIYRQNLQVAYMVGRYESMKEGAALTPCWQYVAVMDASTRPTHAALNSLVFAHDDPIWNTLYPPNGWNCRCRVRPLSKRSLEREGLKVSDSADMDLSGIADEGWDYSPAESGKAARDQLLERTNKIREILGKEAFDELIKSVQAP